MTMTASPILRGMLLIVWHVAAAGQTAELAPLLPPPAPGTEELRAAVMAGNWDRAERLSAVLQEPEKRLWRGIVAIVGNRPLDAIRILPRSGAPKALGVAYYLVRQYLLFRAQMEEAIRLSPGDFGPYYYLGRHYDSDVGDFAEAAKWFALALDRNPEFSLARSYRGKCLERLGRTMEAEAEFHASLPAAQSMEGLARLRLAAGDPKAALHWVEKARASAPADHGAAKLAARIYAALHRPEEAIRALEAAAKLAPRDASILYQLAREYQNAGDTLRWRQTLAEYTRIRGIYGAAP